MTPESHVLGRCLYEQVNRTGPRWAELARLEVDLWQARASELITKLDQHGYRLSYIPPEA